tara:strand:+ start:241 stop:432 length:192 start_codon:yes stop_codon:yes gene_type:complete
MSKINKLQQEYEEDYSICKLPKNHRDYYYIIHDTDRRTGKPRERKIYPNFFIDLVSIPRKVRK